MMKEKKEKKNKCKNVCECGSECTCGDNCECTEEKKCHEECTCENHECNSSCNSECDCECDCGCECESDLLIKELTDKYLRLQAEFTNYQTRTRQETEKMFKYEGEHILKEILPVIDNFERAILMDDRDLSDEVSKFLSGFKMIYTSLLSTLKNLGVEELEVSGKEFDPTIAEAILVEEDKSKPTGVVLEVLQKGYKYKDKVLRLAMVKVNK